MKRTAIRFFALGLLAALPLLGETLALVGGKIYPSPTSEPVRDGIVLVRDGKILAVGEKRRTEIPQDARILDCAGLVLTAGFWNSHVHFVRPEWLGAAQTPAPQLTQQLADMLARYGFTTAVEIASFDLENSKALRRRVETGEIEGPRIFTTGPPLFPAQGTPSYIAPLLRQLGIDSSGFEFATPEQAVAGVRSRSEGGADAIKIFTASPGAEKTVTMPAELIRAITSEAHRLDRRVLAHPHNSDGMDAAIDGGVDILAHTAPNAGEWDRNRIDRMKRAGIALIPTLKLMRLEESDSVAGQKAADLAVGQLRAYAAVGGPILFGTDAGYIAEHDPTEEYRLMARAGMSFRDILTSLTTAPAQRFGQSKLSGRIAPGMEADLVLLSADPEQDVAALSQVRYAIRRGRIIYQDPSPSLTPPASRTPL
jgi:imidazolonepropionase-like amidohydrolase